MSIPNCHDVLFLNRKTDKINGVKGVFQGRDFLLLSISAFAKWGIAVIFQKKSG